MSQHFARLNDPTLIELLMQSGVGVIPTDTVYGLVARASDEQAIRNLYAIKQREIQPGTIVADSIADLETLGFQLSDLSKVAHYWPASISVVLPAIAVPAYLKHVRTDLPVRIPADKSLRKLLRVTGPLMTTSANAPKAPTSTVIDEAVAYFGNDIDFYVDGGDMSDRPPSTIIGFDDAGEIIVHRQGAVTL